MPLLRDGAADHAGRGAATVLPALLHQGLLPAQGSGLPDAAGVGRRDRPRPAAAGRGGRGGAGRHGVRRGGGPRGLRGPGVFVDRPDEPGAGAGRGQAAAEGAIVGGGVDCGSAGARPASSGAGPLRRVAAGVHGPAGAATQAARVLRAFGGPGGAFRRGCAARFFDQGTTPTRAKVEGAEGPDDRRPDLVGGGGGGALRPALADRVVLQGVEGHAGVRPLPAAAVREGGGVDGTGVGDVFVPGMVPGAAVAAGGPVGGREGPLAAAAGVRRMSGVAPSDRAGGPGPHRRGAENARRHPPVAPRPPAPRSNGSIDWSREKVQLQTGASGLSDTPRHREIGSNNCPRHLTISASRS